MLQSVGIIGGLLFTAKTIRDDTKCRCDAIKERKVSNILAFAARHQSLWSDLNQREELKRILQEQDDFLIGGVTPAEVGYLRQQAVQFEAGWEIAALTQPEGLELLALDTANFFSRPLAHLVWEKVKIFRNPRFVELVEAAMNRLRERALGAITETK